jgi:hypothetical protein
MKLLENPVFELHEWGESSDVISKQSLTIHKKTNFKCCIFLHRSICPAQAIPTQVDLSDFIDKRWS